MSLNEEDESSIRFQRNSHPINERLKLSEEQLKKYET